MAKRNTDIDDVLDSIGITPEAVGAIMGDEEDYDTDEPWELVDEVGAALKRAIPTLAPAMREQISQIVNSKQDALEKFYAAAVATKEAALSLAPNASCTLYGDSAAAGATYAANTLVVLRPRNANAIQGTDFAFTKKMTFHSVTCSPIDAANGWRFAGGLFKFSNEIVSGMRFDTSFDIFRPEADFAATPLGVYSGRTPGDNILLSCSALHSQAGGTALVGGVTIKYFDRSCRDEDSMFQDGAATLDFAGLVKGIMSQRVAAKRTIQIARRPAARAPVAIRRR